MACWRCLLVNTQNTCVISVCTKCIVHDMSYLMHFLAFPLVLCTSLVYCNPIQHLNDNRYGSTDPEIWMNVTQIIERWGYAVESYDVQTSDGYILNVQRIPYGIRGPTNCKRPVVFFQHGLECSSSNWITNLPNESAAYLFADAGFDVWMGNFRGNTYGLKHVSMTPDDDAFWKFSWDEMAEHDLPTMIDYVLNATGEAQLYYIGHSQGTMTAFAAFSENQQLASKIKHYYALAPVATVKHLSSYALKFIARFTGVMNFIFQIAGVGQFIPNSWFMNMLAEYVCWGLTNAVCDNIMFLIAGPDSHQLNNTRVPVYVSHTPAGTSTQNIVHFGQMVNSGLFGKYDYGRKENQANYGTDRPPVYDLTQMKVAVSLYYGDTDSLADVEDIHNTLFPFLPNIVQKVPLHDFNHLDFIWGLRAPQQIYHPIIQHINLSRNEKC